MEGFENMMEMPEFGDKLYEEPILCRHNKIPAKIVYVQAQEKPIRLVQRVRFRRLGPRSPGEKICSECHKEDCVCLWVIEPEPKAKTYHDDIPSHSRAHCKLSGSPSASASASSSTKQMGINTATSNDFWKNFYKSYRSTQGKTTAKEIIWIKRPIDLRTSKTSLDPKEQNSSKVQNALTSSEGEKLGLKLNKTLICKKRAPKPRTAGIWTTESGEKAMSNYFPAPVPKDPPLKERVEPPCYSRKHTIQKQIADKGKTNI